MTKGILGIDPRTRSFWRNNALIPTTTLAYRVLLDATDEGRTCGYLEPDWLAHLLGVGAGRGPNSPLGASLRRLTRFGLLFPVPDRPEVIDLPIQVPWLNGGQLDRMRPDLAQVEGLHRRSLQGVTHLHDEA